MHSKVEVRIAHLLGMHSFDDFRVSGLEVRTALILGAHQSLLGMHSLDDFRVGGLEVKTALILDAHQRRN